MNVSVHFFLRGKEVASPGTGCVIYAFVCLDEQKSTAFSTKIKIPVEYWMSEGHPGIKPSSSEYPVSSSYSLSEEINSQLVELKKMAFQAARELEDLDIPVSASTIRHQLLHPEPVVVIRRYSEVLDELIEVLRPKRKKNTMLTYRTRRNNLIEFLEANSSKLHVHQFTYDHFELCWTWMMKQRNEDGSRRWCTNTINKHLTLVNKVLKYAVNKKYIRYSPIGEMGLEYDPTAPPEYLLPSQRRAIYECGLRSLEKERDISVFLFNTGLSYTDYMTLKTSHLHRLDTGEWFLKKPRDKSNIYSILPLLPDAQEIIIKYGSIEQLPRPDISDLNKVLKILGDICKAPFKLSTSSFRETFASMMENEFMIKPRTLMFMMGHTNERQLRNYSSVMPARILHDLKGSNTLIPFNLATYQQLIKAS